MAEPFVFGEITFSETTDYVDLAHAALRDWGLGYAPWDASPLSAVDRVLAMLRDTPWADRLTEGIAACLTAPEPIVRSDALVFFQSSPRAAGGERIVDLVAGDRALFVDIPDPNHPGVTLEHELIVALGARLELGEARALELARAEVMRPGKALPIIGALTGVDAGWVVPRAEQIVRRNPQAGLPMLLRLDRQGHAITQLGRRLAPLGRSDPGFESGLTRFLDDVAVRDAILDSFHDG
jgi:hypothetical protein